MNLHYLHMTALRKGNAACRHWILIEVSAIVAWIFLVVSFLDFSSLKYHLVVMAIGQCLTSFFAVWTVHHDCDKTHYIARTIRGAFKRTVTFNMFYHVEHHLYPQVPTCHLSTLAERLDHFAPELKEKRVF